jgi:hypothetical protein
MISSVLLGTKPNDYSTDRIGYEYTAKVVEQRFASESHLLALDHKVKCTRYATFFSFHRTQHSVIARLTVRIVEQFLQS